MMIKDEIQQRLTAAFNPEVLEIVNESYKHAGHSGDDGTGESHFAIHIRAQALAEMSRLNRHRAVNRALGDLTQRIHAIALDIG